MTVLNNKKGLGKGFGSLLPNDFDESILIDKKDRVQKLLITDIVADPNQPRKSFDEQSLDELADSIRRHGILQPLVVTPSGAGYSIVAGERRYRAAKKAGLTHVPALVRTLKELERLEIGLVENVQRVDLSPFEQAISIARLHEQFNIEYAEIAKRLGKAQSTIVNTVRLLQLPKFAREALNNRDISEGHARAVLALKDNEVKQRELIKKIVQEGWSVRRAEQFVNDSKHKKIMDTGSALNISKQEKILAKDLTAKSGLKVEINRTSKGKKLSIYYKDEKALERLYKKLTN
jgi:ParB family transcriptional regulator, chromosome partitioning protein